MRWKIPARSPPKNGPAMYIQRCWYWEAVDLFPKKVMAIPAVGLKHAPDMLPNRTIIVKRVIADMNPFSASSFESLVALSLPLTITIVNRNVPKASAISAYLLLTPKAGARGINTPVAA